jgi:hypothetical protein
MARDVSELLDRDVDAEERRVRPGAPAKAEVAECTCPEFCERDHDTD